jgi:hypothetical protein
MGKSLEVRPAEMFAMRKAILRIGVDGVVSTVWQIVCKAAGIAMSEDFVIPETWHDKSGKISAKAIHDIYSDGILGIKPHEILGEFDPFFVVDQPMHHVEITGHSHEHKFRHDAEADNVYVNVGCWCSSGRSETYAALVDEYEGDHGEKIAKVALMRFDDGPRPALVNVAEVGRFKP